MKTILFLFGGLCLALSASAQPTSPGTIKSFVEVSRRPGSLPITNDFFEVGLAVTSYPDMDGDGVRELVFRAQDAAGGVKAIFIYRLNSNGALKPNPVMLSSASGPLSTVPTKYPGVNANFIGIALTTLKDLNGNGVDEIVATGGTSGGRLFVLFLNSGGTIDSLTMIAHGYSGFSAPPTGGPGFGTSIANAGDVDNDGVEDLAVGQRGAGTNQGAVYIFFMKNNGTIKGYKYIAHNLSGLGPLGNGTYFGQAVTGIGDLDKDGVPDIMVGSQMGANQSRGEVWTVFLNADGSVKNYHIIQPSDTSILDTVNVGSQFGLALTNIGDLDGDSVTDVATSAYAFKDSLGGTFGRVYILFMNPNGTLKARQFIDRYYGNFSAPNDTLARFGSSLAGFGDINQDGIPDLAVGARDVMVAGNTTGVPSGAIYLMNLNGVAIQTGVGDLLHNFSQHYFLYPNPTSDRLCIRARKPVNVQMRVRLLDAFGRVMATTGGMDGVTSVIDVVSLPPGTYTVAIESGSGVEYGRFVKK